MKTILYNLFGSYTPNTYLVETVTTNPETGESVTTTAYKIAEGMAGVDWEFIAGVLLFAICLWSMFVLIGSMFGGRR